MAPGKEGSSSSQADLMAQLALMQKTIKEQEEKLRIQEETQKEKEEKLVKLKKDKEKLEKMKKEEQLRFQKELEEKEQEKLRLEEQKKQEQERHKKELEEKEQEKNRLEALKKQEEERYKKELEENERKAKEREEFLAQEMKRKEEERLKELEKERMEMRAKEERLKEREDRLSVLENRSSATASVISDDISDEHSLYMSSGHRRKSSVPDSRSGSPCQCFLHGFDKCVLYVRHLCDCSESCNFVREYFSDSSKLEHIAMSSVNSQWMSKHGQAIQKSRKAPPTPPSYEKRSLMRKSPQPQSLDLII